MPRWLLPALLIFSLSAMAADKTLQCAESDERTVEEIEKSKERQVCPNMTDDANTLLTSIKTLEDELRKSPECQGVLDKVSVISKITTNKKWKELVNVFSATDPSSGNGAMGSMETSDIEEMSKSATDAAVALADTVALLSGSSKHCLPKEKASFLSSLSQVTKEVSTVVGSIASGPMGPGVSIVGNMIASAISGIDKLFKGGKVYDFNKPAERILFMNQFCAFTEIQQDINDYLQLDKKAKELAELKACYLSPKIKLTTENCPECKGYELAFRENLESQKLINAIIEDASIVPVESMSMMNSSFSRCGEINRAFYSKNSDLQRYVERLRAYAQESKNPYISSSDRDTINDFVLAFEELRRLEIYPRYSKCVSSDSAFIRDISIRFNNFIRDEVIGYHNKLFNQQMNVFRREANRIYTKVPGQTLPGDSISKSMDIEKWANEEVIRIHAKVSEVNYRKSREEVMIQQNLLRDRITMKLMPHYLKYLFKDTNKRIESFRKEINKVAEEQISYYAKRMKKKITTLEQLTAEIKRDKSMSAELVSAFDRVFRNFEIVDIRKREVIRYCDYLAFSLALVPENRDICNEGIKDMNQELDKNSEVKKNHEVIVDFNKWARKNIQLHSTYVESYAQKMRDFLATSGPGSPRWTRTDVKKPVR